MTKLAKFIATARNIHGDKYCYSKIANCANKNTKVEILCKIHGSFFQKFSKHINAKQGCAKCSGNIKFNLSKTIDEAQKIHSNFYTYEKIKSYNSRHEKLEITCPIHGSFWQDMHHHINSKKGCLQCGGRYQSNDKDFIKKAIKIHGNKYSYNNVIYDKSNIKVIITCNIHKYDFKQKPSKHLLGQGCPICAVNNKSKKENDWINFLCTSNGNLKRQEKIVINNKRFFVDALDPITKTCYEFNGDYWHGNPKIYNPEKIHPIRNKTYGELHQETLNKEIIIKNAGYNVVSIWESDWNMMEASKNK